MWRHVKLRNEKTRIRTGGSSFTLPTPNHFEKTTKAPRTPKGFWVVTTNVNNSGDGKEIEKITGGASFGCLGMGKVKLVLVALELYLIADVAIDGPFFGN